MKPLMTCNNNIQRFLKLAKTPQNILWSYKLDGVRVVAEVSENGKVKYYSRTLKEYRNFGCFNQELITLARSLGIPYPVLFDGEVMAKKEGFRGVMTQALRIKDVDASGLEYRVFDLILDKELFVREALLERAFEDQTCETVKLLKHHIPVIPITSEGQIYEMAHTAVVNGYEGIVLKTSDGEYEHKRSGLWCKVKPVETLDLLVTGFIEGEGQHKGKIGALLCENADGSIRVSVGTGLSDTQRREYMCQLPNLIEVKYQERTKDSLRFPVFVRSRMDKTEVSL